MLVGGVVLGVVLLAVGTAALVRLRRSARSDPRRTREAEAFAAAQGWDHVRRSDEQGSRYLGFPCGQGEERHGEHVMTGRYRGHGITVAEQVFTVTADGVSRTRRFLVASVDLPAAGPTVQVEPRRRRGGGPTGEPALRGISLGRPDLDRAFAVRTDDAELARTVLSEHTGDWMLHDPRFAHVPLRFERADLVAWRSGPLVLTLVLPLLDLLVELRERVPTGPLP